MSWNICRVDIYFGILSRNLRQECSFSFLEITVRWLVVKL